MKVEEESRSRESFFMRSVSGPKCIYNLQFSTYQISSTFILYACNYNFDTWTFSFP